MTSGNLQLTGSVVVCPHADELYDVLAHDFLDAAVAAVQERGEFHLALSGGSTPEPFYMRLMVDPRYRLAPWKQTHVWLVDERRVPPTDERSNYRMIRETLLDHIPTRGRLLHPMPVLDDNAPAAYEAELRRHLPDGRLDLVMLGMGDDGHTASLFPQSPALEAGDRWVAANHGPRVKPPERLTMTYPLLNAARFVAILVTGEGKAAAVRRIEDQLRRHGPAPRELPVTGIQPDPGRLCWYLDGAAAGSDGMPEQIELA